MLAAELTAARQRGRRRRRDAAPLAEAFAERFRTSCRWPTYPVRVGTHYNTAFALLA
jgi:hypothetical protein